MTGSIFDITQENTGVLLYLETGEDTALTFTQGSPPVDGVYRLTVEDGAVEQLHHDPPQLCGIIQAWAVGWYQRLWYRQRPNDGQTKYMIISKYGWRTLE